MLKLCRRGFTYHEVPGMRRHMAVHVWISAQDGRTKRDFNGSVSFTGPRDYVRLGVKYKMSE